MRLLNEVLSLGVEATTKHDWLIMHVENQERLFVDGT